MLAIFGILLLVSSSLCAPHISYSGNVTSEKNVEKNGWRFRPTRMWDFDLDLLGVRSVLSTQFHSKVVGAAKKTTDIDAVYGGLAIYSEQLPYSFVTYFSKSGEWDNKDNFLDADTKSSAGYIASAYAYLIEKNSSGDVIKTISLRDGSTLAPMDVSWARENSTETSSNGLSWASFIATPNDNSGWSISLTLIASNVVGRINYANAIVGPMSVETVVSIQNYPYQNSSNTLTLGIAIGTGSASSSSSASAHSLINGQVYFSSSAVYMSGGKSVHAIVSPFQNGTFLDIGNAEWQSQVKSKYTLESSLQLVNITFGPGETDILYDPALGAGEVILNAENSNSGEIVRPVLISSLVLVFMMLLW